MDKWYVYTLRRIYPYPEENKGLKRTRTKRIWSLENNLNVGGIYNFGKGSGFPGFWEVLSMEIKEM